MTNPLNDRFLRVTFQQLSNSQYAGETYRLPSGTSVNLEGTYVKLMWDLRDSLDLTLELLLEKENDLNWKTPISRIANGTVDLAAMPVTQSYFWKGIGLGSSFVFTHAIISETQNLYFRQPYHKNYPSILLRPFQLSFWIATLTNAVITIVFTILFKLLIEKLFKHSEDSLNGSDIFIQTAALLIGRIFPKLPYGKFPITILTGILLKSVLINVYTAKVISTFANDDGRLVKHREDLIKFSYTFSTWGDYRIDRLYRKSVHSKLAKQPFIEMNSGNVVDITRQMISQKGHRKLTILTHSPNFYIGSSFGGKGFDQEFCSVMYFPSKLKYPRSMVIRKDYPIREEINFKLLQLNERGFKFRYYTAYLRKIEYKCVPERVNIVPITNKHVAFAYFLLFGGALTSIIIQIVVELRKRYLFYVLTR